MRSSSVVLSTVFSSHVDIFFPRFSVFLLKLNDLQLHTTAIKHVLSFYDPLCQQYLLRAQGMRL